ncbi:MAG: hypothetical protein ABR497_11425 [Kiritimatiellia bacterium]
MPNADVPQYHRFAWDGFSFEVPVDWELSHHQTHSGFAQIEMEDDVARRLEMEWTRMQASMTSDKINRRYEKLAGEVRVLGGEASPVTEPPPGWSACLYSMPDGRRLLTAFFQASAGLHCLFKFHFERASYREPLRVFRRLAETFKVMLHGPVIWEFLDVAFQLNPECRMTGISLQAGSKLMEFDWRWRRLFLWVFSPADVILRQTKSPDEWCAKILNKYKDIRGAVFRPGPRPGELVWRREWRYIFGRFEDLYRRCNRYRAVWQVVEQKNQLLLTVYHYRTESDLSTIGLQWL